jgi:hypothetical protein
LRAARANPVFGTDEKRIRTKNTVMDKSNNGLGLVLYKIADCVRMCFSSAHNRRSARTAAVRAIGATAVRATADASVRPCNNRGAI